MLSKQKTGSSLTQKKWIDEEHIFTCQDFPVMFQVQGLLTRRWYKNQIYVNETKQVYLNYKVNGQGGTTVSVGNRGWAVVYQHARVLAGWDELPKETK